MNDETYPPETGRAQVPPVDETPQTQVALQEPPPPPNVPPIAVAGGSQPNKPPKQKIDWPFAILGFFTPPVALAVAGAALNLLASSGTLAPVFGSLGALLQVAVVIAAIAAFVVGSRRGNNKLRSFAIGALWAYVAYTLIALIAFGACLISLGGGGAGLFGG